MVVEVCFSVLVKVCERVGRLRFQVETPGGGGTHGSGYRGSGLRWESPPRKVLVRPVS